MVIIELMLSIGLSCILGLVAFIHFISTTSIPWIIETTKVDPEPQLHPLFFTIEAVLALSAMYIFINVIS